MGNNSSGHPEDNPTVAWYILASVVVMVISIIISLIIWIKREAKIKKYIEIVNKSSAKLKNLSEILKKYNVSIIPPNYRYRKALDFIYKALLNQRATTMQQAVNLYEDDLHKRNMESLQKQQVEILKKQASDIKKLQKSTKRIEWIQFWEIFSK